jgi:hypothetical protein
VELLKFSLSLGAVVGVVKGIQLFSRHCLRRFGYSFFTVRGFWIAAIAINLLWWGYVAWGTALLHHEPISGGLILVAMGFAAAVWLVRENVRGTDLLYGTGGSALQLIVFFPVALYGVPLLAITLLFLLFASFKAGPAWLIGR